MGFWRTAPGILIVSLLTLLVAVGGLTGLAVHRATVPERHVDPPIDFESMMMSVEEVEFPSADGLTLRGWYIAGQPDHAAVILCHDWGASKGSLVNLAIALRREGFPVLLFDFRGHGESGGGRSTLGLLEKREILGAVDYLAGRDDVDTDRIGLYGVGMGAHAAVLAASDRPNLKVLVLDALYPDVSYRLSRRVYVGSQLAARHLSFLTRAAFLVLCGANSGGHRASDAIERLLGRDLLLLASERNVSLGDEMRGMYEKIPEQPDVDGNLVFLPATQVDGLFGEQMTEYHARVSGFFASRLAD